MASCASPAILRTFCGTSVPTRQSGRCFFVPLSETASGMAHVAFEVRRTQPKPPHFRLPVISTSEARLGCCSGRPGGGGGSAFASVDRSKHALALPVDEVHVDGEREAGPGLQASTGPVDSTGSKQQRSGCRLPPTAPLCARARVRQDPQGLMGRPSAGDGPSCRWSLAGRPARQPPVARMLLDVHPVTLSAACDDGEGSRRCTTGWLRKRRPSAKVGRPSSVVRRHASCCRHAFRVAVPFNIPCS